MGGVSAAAVWMTTYGVLLAALVANNVYGDAGRVAAHHVLA